VCGDHLTDSGGTHVEECDDGIDNTNDPLCPYNDLCPAACSKTATG